MKFINQKPMIWDSIHHMAYSRVLYQVRVQVLIQRMDHVWVPVRDQVMDEI